jgi:hypothetical protein
MKRFKPYLITFLITLFVVSAVAAITQIDLYTQVKGVLATANGGTGQNSSATFPTSGTIATAAATLTSGRLLIGGGTQAVNVGDLSGDVTTSGSAVTTVVKVNGTTVGTNSASDQTIVTTASATGSWATLPNGVVQYSTSTHLFSAATVLTGTIVDNETPSGTCDGSNAAFTLAHTPSSAANLHLHKNGQLMTAGGADFTLATATITFVTAAKPCQNSMADVLLADYRY